MRHLSILGLAILAGCYSYVSTEPPTLLDGGTPVRAHLSSPMDLRVSDLTVNNTVLVHGEVVHQNGDSLMLSAFSLRSQSGYEFPASGETLTLPANRIAQLDQKRFDALRSGIVLTGAALVSTLVFSLFDTGGSGGTGGTSPPPSSQ